ncbi:MAG TPA: hypothetical protein VHV30_16015 [Polyangiaceae bacterium]|nr:hypothetical protein [Polyangiaceae bacterium]
MIPYQLGPAEAKRRAAWAAGVGAVTTLAPVVLALELVPRLGWSPPAVFWGVAVAVGALIVVRTVTQFAMGRRRLTALRVRVDDASITTENARTSLTIMRAEVERIVEIAGTLGGIRVEARPDPRTGVVLVASVPRGGESFGDVRAALEQWRPIERRPRASRAVRVGMGVGVVAAIFFLPFVLDELVDRSKAVAAVIVLLAWAVMRWVLRGR